jgi:hypothetical protein
VDVFVGPGDDEDVEHAIPRLDTLDALLTTDRGAYVGIVIATPLRDDAVSRARLLRKVEVSVSYFLSDEFRVQYGVPTPDNARLRIHVHAGSVASMLALIHNYCSQVLSNGISPEVELIGTH